MFKGGAIIVDEFANMLHYGRIYFRGVTQNFERERDNYCI